MSLQQPTYLSHPKYRPDIDGLRAVAVFAIVVFHAFPSWARGGFIGVDVFFVISGYLISIIIFENLDRGKFSFTEFYDRRIRRIFPALILVLIASFSFGWFALLAHEYKLLGRHIAGGAGFVSNFILWNEAGYFDNASETKPLLHLWSLAIEVQFYIVCPLILWFAWKIRLNLLIITTTIVIALFVLNIKFVLIFTTDELKCASAAYVGVCAPLLSIKLPERPNRATSPVDVPAISPIVSTPLKLLLPVVAKLPVNNPMVVNFESTDAVYTPNVVFFVSILLVYVARVSFFVACDAEPSASLLTSVVNDAVYAARVIFLVSCDWVYAPIVVNLVSTDAVYVPNVAFFVFCEAVYALKSASDELNDAVYTAIVDHLVSLDWVYAFILPVYAARVTSLLSCD
jgi:peptidoglycan/LPS O-acetylase OafA/YrhL